MIEIEYTEHFKKKYKKLIGQNPLLRKRFETQVDKFISNLYLGGIHSHKVNLGGLEVFVFSVTGDLRVAYYWDNGRAVFIDIDTHDSLYR